MPNNKAFSGPECTPLNKLGTSNFRVMMTQAELDEFWEWLVDRGRKHFDQAAVHIAHHQPFSAGLCLQRAYDEMLEDKQQHEPWRKP